MAVGRSAALKIDWTRITSSLGLKGQTASSLAAFKKRNDDARRKLLALQALPTSVDFATYRSSLGNTAIVDEVEKQVKGTQVKRYDVDRQIKAIEAFETQAVKSAQETKRKVDDEVETLGKTLKDIEEARPWEDVTLDDLRVAAPEWDKSVERMVAKGKWMPKGYQEKFGDLSVI